MADRHWVGASAGSWNVSTNWSATQGGPGLVSGGVPVAGDDVFISKLVASNQFLNVNQDIGNINSINFPDVSAAALVSTKVGGATNDSSGTTWNVPTSVSVVVDAGTQVVGVINLPTNGGTIVKTGPGLLWRTATSTTFGATAIDLQEGELGLTGINNSLGTGTITMSAGTSLSNTNASVAYSIQNPIVINGNVSLARRLDPTTSSLAALTITGTVTLGSSNRTITHSGEGASNNAVILTGAISGTAGITVDSATTGTGYLQASNASSGLSGEVTVQGTATLWLGSYTTSGLIWENAGTFNVAATGATLQWSSNAAFTVANPLTGTGNFLFSNSAASPGTTLPTLVNITNSSATIGCGALIANSQNTTITVSDFAPTMAWDFVTANTGTIQFKRSGSGIYSTASNFNIVSIVAGTAALLVDQPSAHQALEITGDISQTRASGTALTTLRLYGATDGTVQRISGDILRPTNSTTNALAVRVSQGTWYLSGANDYLAAITIDAAPTGSATVQLAALSGGATTGALGGSTSTATITIGDAVAGNTVHARLSLVGGVDVNVASRPVTVYGGVTGGSGARIVNGSLSNVLRTGTITFLAGAIGLEGRIVASSGSLEITGLIGNSSTSSFFVEGGGVDTTVRLSNTSSTTAYGPTIRGVTCEVTRLASVTNASSVGTRTSAGAYLTIGGYPSTRLRHVGTSPDTTSGAFLIGSFSTSTTQKTIYLDSTGVGGLMLITGTLYSITGSSPWVLAFEGSNTGGTNVYTGDLANGTGANLWTVDVTKSGSNTWQLNGDFVDALNLTVTGGVFAFNSTFGNQSVATLDISASSEVSLSTSSTEAITATVATNLGAGTLTATLAGSAPVTVSSAATDLAPAKLAPQDPTTGSNTVTGNVAVNGTLDLVTKDSVLVSTATYGRVCGASNTVTVSSTGTIRTKTSGTSNQRGQARYNNLTLQSGSKVKIGMAA